MKQSENPVINANSLFDLIKFFHSNLKSKFSSTYFHSQIGDSPLSPPPPPRDRENLYVYCFSINK